MTVQELIDKLRHLPKDAGVDLYIKDHAFPNSGDYGRLTDVVWVEAEESIDGKNWVCLESN